MRKYLLPLLTVLLSASVVCNIVQIEAYTPSSPIPIAPTITDNFDDAGIPGILGNGLKGTSGSLNLGRSGSTSGTDVWDIRCLRRANYSGGISGFVNRCLDVTDVVGAGTRSDESSSLAYMDNNATLSDGSENNAGYFRSIKETTGNTWAATFECDDKNYTNASTGACVGAEINVFANGPDLAQNRSLLTLFAGPLTTAQGGTNAPPVIGYGMKIGPQFDNPINATWHDAIWFGPGRYDSLLDMQKITVCSQACIWLPADAGTVLFGTVSGKQAYQYYSSSTKRLEFDSGFGTLRQGLYSDGTIQATDSAVDLRMVPLGGSNVGLLGTYSNHDLVFDTNGAEVMRLHGGGVQLGSNGAASANVLPGEVAYKKVAASGAAPGTGWLKIETVSGTNAGTCKLIAYAGISTTPVTIVDNVGSGC
jgi:hypothetical protein